MTYDTDVLIVGGGPVGMGLAIELAQRGVPSTVVERYPEPQRVPKGQNLTQRTMEHFAAWGAEKELRAARTIPREYGIGGLTAYGTLLGPYSYDWLQRELVRPYYTQDTERLPQYATEAVLRRRAAMLPAIRTLYGWTAQGISQDETGATASITQAGGGQEMSLRARYLVGCDGSRSVVRESAGITQALTEHDRLMVLLVFRSRQLHTLLERFPGKSYFNVLQPELKGYWKFFGRVDLGTTWFFHAPVPPGTTRDNFDFRTYLHEAVGAQFDVEFEHVGFWELRFAVADSYRSGRVFVAGDAAHSHPPYGGYGINTGFEDARNLGWKLAAVLKGWGGPLLLDSYDAERRPVFESTARDFIAKSIETDREFLGAYDPAVDRPAFESAWSARSEGAVGEVNAFEPHYEGSPIVKSESAHGDAQCGAIGSHSFQARPGHHLSPARVASGVVVTDELGPDYSLLVFGAAPDAAGDFGAEAKKLGIPLKVIRHEQAGEAARYQAGMVLVRADHFVAWACEDHGTRTDAAQVLLKAIGAS
jgi:2-polyprenyl-6-methoxyphenol hydroxylase-like FAD-dependent oxidoreductase